MGRKKQYLVIFNKNKEEIVSDFMHIADDFYYSTIALLEAKGDMWSYYLMPSGFLAARSAECYIKALLLSYDLTETTYKFCLDSGHNLVRLLEKLIEYEPDAVRLKCYIEWLNKYSDDKVSYPEFQYTDGAPDMFGSDEVWPIKAIRDYAFNKLGWT